MPVHKSRKSSIVNTPTVKKQKYRKRNILRGKNNKR